VNEAVIASEAKQSIAPRKRKNGLLRRSAPLRKRFAFVADNDEIEGGGALLKDHRKI
jgi:hypothetical protein